MVHCSVHGRIESQLAYTHMEIRPTRQPLRWKVERVLGCKYVSSETNLTWFYVACFKQTIYRKLGRLSPDLTVPSASEQLLWPARAARKISKV